MASMSCRPQAWAAAAGPALLTALLGLDVDVPPARIALDPLSPSRSAPIGSAGCGWPAGSST